MDDLKLYIALSRTYLYFERIEKKNLKKFDLTIGQFAVLEILYHKKELNAKQIKEHILMTQGNLPVVIKNLIKQGYIEKVVDPSDRRKSLLKLTDKGTEKIQEVFPHHKKLLEEIIGVWSEEEKKQLFNILKNFRSKYYE